MLRPQYGTNAPSIHSTGGHAEDAQPNETINKRAQKLPPMIRTTTTTHPDFNQRGRGGYRGRGGVGRGRAANWNQRGQWNHRGNWNQRGSYTARGESSWRGRGRHDSHGLHYEEPSYSSSRRQSLSVPSEETPRRDSTKRPHSPSSAVKVSAQTSSASAIMSMFRSKSPPPKMPVESTKKRKLDDESSEFRNKQQGRLRSSLVVEAPNLADPLNASSLNSEGRTFTTSRRTDAFAQAQDVVKIEQSPVKHQKEITVKLEHRSPSPTAILPQRKLVTESCTFYPYPEVCKNSNPHFRDNRKAFFMQKNKELAAFGLKRTNVLSRDDGLVIEWTSPIPVWSDTLLPDADPSPALRSVSPAPDRRLVTSSQSFYPYPESCKGPDPESRARRKAFHIEKNRELIALGLKRTRAYSKDGGLIMEWTSPVPVWSDTLQPEIQDLASVLQIAHSVNYELTTTSPKGSKKSKERSASIISVSSSLVHLPEPRPSPEHLQSPSEANTSRFTANTGTPTSRKQSGNDFEPGGIPSCHQRQSPGLHSLPRRRLPPIPNRLMHQHQEVESAMAYQLNPTSRYSPADLNDSEIAALMVGYSQDRLDHPLMPAEAASEVKEEGSAAELASTAPTVKRMVFKLNRNLPRKNSSSSTAAPAPTSLGPCSSDNNSIQQADKTQHAKNIKDHLTRNLSSPIILKKSTASNMGVPARPEVNTVFNDPVTYDSDECQDLEIHRVTDEADGSDIEHLASTFLQRYCRLFDTDRSKLEMAYDKNALFSCRAHHLEEHSFSMAGLFAPETSPAFRSSHTRASASSVQQGRIEIANKLVSLGPYLFCPRDVTSCLQYDVVESPAGILLTVHGEIVNPNPAGSHMDHVLTLDQSFVLRERADEDDEVDAMTRSGDSQDSLGWPLTVISHQMTVRAVRMLTAAQIDELLPWTKSIF